MILGQRYRISVGPGPDEGWNIDIVAYSYELLDHDSGLEILAYHWHPEGPSAVNRPHLHPGPALRAAIGVSRAMHLPTGHVAIQDFVLMTIDDFEARPLRPDWREILEAASGAGPLR